MTSRLVHLSDLHFGAGARFEDRSAELVDAVLAGSIDHVVVTGDVTHRGRWDEYEAFEDTFEPLLHQRRLTVVPGNHDRPGDDVADTIMHGERVRVKVVDRVYMVLVDSTGPHNQYVFAGHGMLAADDLRRIDDALRDAPADYAVALLMHHHPYPLPAEGALEQLASLVGLPFAAELAEGEACLELARGRCDLLLHGHRHVPTMRTEIAGGRPLRVVNAGCSPALGVARVFAIDGRRIELERHVELPGGRPRRAWEATAAPAACEA